MRIHCKSCMAELFDEYAGVVQSDTICPKCGKPLVRNLTLVAEAAECKLTFSDIQLTHRIYPEALIEEVKDLIGRDKFTLAVVVAQMSCEIIVERALTRAFADKGLEYLEETVTKMLSGRSITNGNVRKLLESLTGRDTLADLQQMNIWDGLRNLTSWRNAAVHRGKIWTKSEAESALKVATKLVEYFKQ